MVQAYQWSSMLERRRPVLAAWSDYVTGKTDSNVVPFERGAAVSRIAISRARRLSRAIMATLSGLALLITAAPVSATQASTASSPAIPAQAGAASHSTYIGEVSAVIRSRLFYPSAARARGAKGVVGVAFTIGASGAVASFAITRSSGDHDLDAAARSLVQGGRFPPPPGGSAHIATSFVYTPH